MHHRPFGSTRLLASRIGLGCVTFGREIDKATSFEVLDRAFDHGINLFDTAEAYGGRPLAAEAGAGATRSYSSELILGRWLESRGVRDRVIVETKMLPPLTPARIEAGIDDALRRLRTDRIDLFLFHAYDSATPLAESMRAVARAMKAGKVLHFGVSNFTAGQVEEAIVLTAEAALPSIACVQMNYSLAMRDAEADHIPLCSRHGIGVQTYSPLGAGFLMGKYSGNRSAVPKGSRFDVAPGHADLYFHPAKFEQAERLRRLADQTQRPRSELAIAWVLKNPDVTNVLIGAREPAQVDAAIRASQLRYDTAWDEVLISSGDMSVDV